ncbi:hypothetical protein QJQ45_004808 [Haematococcus lacustris]|nr:hypothetical protein QJQ45_004808 [Haematococcus lacustris]
MHLIERSQATDEMEQDDDEAPTASDGKLPIEASDVPTQPPYPMTEVVPKLEDASNLVTNSGLPSQSRTEDGQAGQEPLLHMMGATCPASLTDAAVGHLMLTASSMADDLAAAPSDLSLPGLSSQPPPSPFLGLTSLSDVLSDAGADGKLPLRSQQRPTVRTRSARHFNTVVVGSNGGHSPVHSPSQSRRALNTNPFQQSNGGVHKRVLSRSTSVNHAELSLPLRSSGGGLQLDLSEDFTSTKAGMAWAAHQGMWLPGKPASNSTPDDPQPPLLRHHRSVGYLLSGPRSASHEETYSSDGLQEPGKDPLLGLLPPLHLRTHPGLRDSYSASHLAQQASNGSDAAFVGRFLSHTVSPRSEADQLSSVGALMSRSRLGYLSGDSPGTSLHAAEAAGPAPVRGASEPPTATARSSPGPVPAVANHVDSHVAPMEEGVLAIGELAQPPGSQPLSCRQEHILRLQHSFQRRQQQQQQHRPEHQRPPQRVSSAPLGAYTDPAPGSDPADALLMSLAAQWDVPEPEALQPKLNMVDLEMVWHSSQTPVPAPPRCAYHFPVL